MWRTLLEDVEGILRRCQGLLEDVEDILGRCWGHFSSPDSKARWECDTIEGQSTIFLPYRMDCNTNRGGRVVWEILQLTDIIFCTQTLLLR
jgi:hypothetical protein